MNEHAAHRLLEHLFCFGRGVADILADEVVARHRHEMAPAHVAEPMKDLGHALGDRRLAGAGIAGEAHVQGRRLRGETELRAHAVDQQQRRDFANALLDGSESNQLIVKLLQNGADARLRELLREVDLRRRRLLNSAPALMGSAFLPACRSRKPASRTAGRGHGRRCDRDGNPPRSSAG